MKYLHEMSCSAITDSKKLLNQQGISNFLKKLNHNWQLEDEKTLSKEFFFPDFLSGLNFVHRIAEIAEAEEHHPDVYLSYKKVKIILTTHDVNGLTLCDFIMAAKIQQLV